MNPALLQGFLVITNNYEQTKSRSIEELMKSKSAKGLTKHADFILLDMICLQVSFVLAYWIFREFSNPYDNDPYQYQAVVLLASQLLVIAFGNGYSGILRRGKLEELVSVLWHIMYILVIALLYLFVVHRTNVVSRLQYSGTVTLFILIDWLVRLANKYRLKGYKKIDSALMVITTHELLPNVMQKINKDQKYLIGGIFLLDKNLEINRYDEIPVYPYGGDQMEKFIKQWVDEVLIVAPEGGEYYQTLSELSEKLINSGIAVSFTLSIPVGGSWTYLELRKIGEQKVFTAVLRSASRKEEVLKRGMDIVVSIIGCIITGLIMLIVGPIIYIKSPGSIIFTQERIGRNGRPFKMFKIRTMYPDAEARKGELIEKNRVGSGMMFKLDDDPRIIGSEKKDKKGKPKGIGNILRKYSLDEFPQFFNVLRGDMSVVGWRPCTLSEWEKYNLKDRIRASMKPGITGLWQVSGRSSVVDFDEVVRYDREYLENWSWGLDVRIMLKTIWVMISGKGAM